MRGTGTEDPVGREDPRQRPAPGASSVSLGEVLARELNHRSRECHDRQVSCEVFRGAKPAIKVYTHRERRETFDWINELTMMLVQVWAVHTQPPGEPARRLALETLTQGNGVIAITQNRKVTPVSLEPFTHY